MPWATIVQQRYRILANNLIFALFGLNIVNLINISYRYE